MPTPNLAHRSSSGITRSFWLIGAHQGSRGLINPRGRRQSSISSNHARYQSKWCIWALITQKWQNFWKFRKIQRLPSLFRKSADRAHPYEEYGAKSLLSIEILTYKLSQRGWMLTCIETWCVLHHLPELRNNEVWQKCVYKPAMSLIRDVAGTRYRPPALSGRGESGRLA